jgi:hypothetical protein
MRIIFIERNAAPGKAVSYAQIGQFSKFRVYQSVLTAKRTFVI